MILESILVRYGYPILYIGTIIEGETFVIISAILSQTGHLELTRVMVTAFLGALSGDLVCYQIGRLGCDAFSKKKTRWQKQVDRGTRLLRQHENLIIFSYRFFYGLRAVIPIMIGMAGYNVKRFILLSAAGALVWSVVVSLAGYICGKVLLLLIADIKQYQLGIILGLGFISVAVSVLFCLKNR